MIISLLLGSFTVIVTMSIQVVFVVMMIRYLIKTIARDDRIEHHIGFDAFVIGTVMLVLFAGHLAQIVIWGMLFLLLDEFDSFSTAVYHSAVNFSSLGYGDIVMSDRWRILGPLEASNGVLMFGLSTGTILSVMSQLFVLRNPGGLKNSRKK